jgi:uncharacterized coiled-coil protein SlyX
MDNFPIFQAEIDAGLAEVLANPANACIVAHSPLALPKGWKEIQVSSKARAIAERAAAQANDSEELYRMLSVLVSVGWNLNDEVFLKDRMWAARNTPEDKRFDYRHKDQDILGHIVGNYVVDNAGNVIPDDTKEEDLPDEFHIVAETVIYKDWKDEDQQKRVDTIIAEIETALASEDGKDTKWYVSMECNFYGFDYAIKDRNNKVSIVERTQATAVLTKYLRAYGGNGYINDYQIGRVPKNISYSGLGLVENPGNPQSIIFNGVLSFREEQTSQVQEIMEIAMANDNSKDTTAADALIAEYKGKIETLEAAKNDLNTKVGKLEAEIANKDNEIKTLNAKVTETEGKVEAAKTEAAAKLDEINKKLEESEKALAEIKAAEVKSNRVAQLVEKGLAKEDAEATVVKFAKLSDEQFTAIAALVNPVKTPEVKKPTEAEAAEAAAKVLETAKADEAAKLAAAGPDVKEEAEKAKAELVGFVKTELAKNKNKKK